MCYSDKFEDALISLKKIIILLLFVDKYANKYQTESTLKFSNLQYIKIKITVIVQ